MSRLNIFVVIISLCQVLFVKSGNLKFVTCKNNEICVPLNECEEVKNKVQAIIKNPFRSSEDKNYFKQVQCKVENRTAYVCCQSNVNLQSKLLKAPKCGLQFNNRIIGGSETNIDEYPWTVQLFHKDVNGSFVSFCGGALINERYVLTAAHCTNLNLVKVRLGDWDVRTNPDCQDEDYEQKCNDPYVEIPIENIIVHDDYELSNRNQCNDIALIKLRENVTFSEFIKPICLPVDQYVRNLNMTGHHVEVAGFGLTRVNILKTSDIKMKLDMSVSSQSYCENLYVKNNVTINSKQICAGGQKGKDTCNGDSGYPLMKQITKPREISYYALIGIVSFGPTQCGTKDHPGIYTRVSEFLHWIVDNMD